jgi:predicted secreted protein
VEKPVNSPFCNECCVDEFKQGKINEIPEWFLLEMLRKKMNERELDPQIRDFVEKNLATFVNWVVEDRRIRGLSSLTVKS